MRDRLVGRSAQLAVQPSSRARSAHPSRSTLRARDESCSPQPRSLRTRTFVPCGKPLCVTGAAARRAQRSTRGSPPRAPRRAGRGWKCICRSRSQYWRPPRAWRRESSDQSQEECSGSSAVPCDSMACTACATSTLASTCGRCETLAIRRSWASGSIATGRAPMRSISPRRRSTAHGAASTEGVALASADAAPSPDSSLAPLGEPAPAADHAAPAAGVRYQVAPSNRSSRALATPAVSAPAEWVPADEARIGYRADDRALGRAYVADHAFGAGGLQSEQGGVRRRADWRGYEHHVGLAHRV